MSGRAPLAVAGPAYVGLAEVAYQRNELDTALDHVTEGIALCRQFVYTTPLATGLADAGVDPAGHRRPGRRPGCDRRGRAGRAGPARPGQPRPGATGPAAAGPGRPGRRCPLDGRPRPRPRTTNRTMAASRDSCCWPGCCSPRGGPPRRSRCWTGCTRQRSPRTGPAASSRSARCERWRWRPAARKPAAVTVLSRALTFACPQGYVRVFADEGKPMAALLGRLIAAQRAGQAAAGVPLGCLARLQRAFDVGHAGPGPGPARPPWRCRAWSSALTSRELEVLAMLAAGRSNQAIAAAARGHPRHRQEARQPRPGQARRGQPHRGRQPRTRAQA